MEVLREKKAGEGQPAGLHALQTSLSHSTWGGELVLRVEYLTPHVGVHDTAHILLGTSCHCLSSLGQSSALGLVYLL